MKLGGIVRFELAYQIRRLQTWLFFAALAAVAFLSVRENFLADALYDDFFLNSPFVIAMVTVLCGVIWLLTAGSVAGEAAARDVQTGMDPLTYTAPASKFEYLGGRFLAALAVNALILLGVPAGILLAVYLPGVEAEVIGPLRLAAYLTAYAFIALPNAFVTTAIQFSVAALGRRVKASYVGSVLVFFQGYIVCLFVAIFFGKQELAKLLDPLGVFTIVSTLPTTWTPLEKSTRLVMLEGTLLSNRLLWVGIGVAALAFTYLRFRFVHRTAGRWWSRILRRRVAHSPKPVRSAISIPHVRRTFGFAIHVRQTLAIMWTSLRTIAMSWGGLPVWSGIALLMVVVMPEATEHQGMPLTPRTAYVVSLLGAPLTNPVTPWLVIQLLTIIYAGELVWREREAGMGEITDATPVPEWVPFLGKFLGLGVALAAWLALLTAAAMLVQVRMGHHDFQIGLYLQTIFGLRLADYLLFALLVLVLNVLVNQKYVAHLVGFIAAALICFSGWLRIENRLFIYGADPGWSYTDMRGFGGTLGPWLWFKLYWAAWALLLAVVARLLWVRGKEASFASRLQLARRRITPASAVTAAAAVLLILGTGGFIFYNTNVLSSFRSPSERADRRAEYERRYKRYERIPQPRLAGMNLHVEIYPERRAVDVRGAYELVNRSAGPIDSIQVATVPGVETRGVSFDRPAKPALLDQDHFFSIYTLERPLQPGDSLQLRFEVHHRPRGFRNSGVDTLIAGNGTYFTNERLLPSIGYQSGRELITAGDRRAQGLAPRPIVPSVDDVEARGDVSGRPMFEATVGTSADQIAVAPGVLKRTWTDPSGRRYFHYATDAPVGETAFFSAKYARRDARWNDVTIEVFHHPAHTANVDRIIQSAQAALDYHTRHFSPYPHSVLRFIEHPGLGIGMHADAAQINYSEGSALLNPAADERGFDLAYAVIAHEVAHQWWGGQLPYAAVQGLGLLSESPAWYTAMGVVKEAKGVEELQRLRRFFRQPYPILPIRQSVPLLRSLDPYAFYRKGPAALWALRDAIGEERVNTAYRRLLEKHGSGEPPLPTSLDLYRELKAVTPPEFQTLLHDLFEANTFWEMKAERATAKQTAAGTWQVTLDLDVRKEVVNPAGVATPVPMDDLVEIGVFAPAEEGQRLGPQIYLKKHRIRAGKQTITVTVPGKPERAGIDPYHLLIEWKREDNGAKVKVQS